MQKAEDPSELSRQGLYALVLAAIVFGAILVGISACGGGDLGFPGSARPTSTAAPTETPTPNGG
jgi:hypothetical protein